MAILARRRIIPIRTLETDDVAKMNDAAVSLALTWCRDVELRERDGLASNRK